MFEPIYIEYTWTKELFLKAGKSAYDYELKNSPKRFLGWIFIAMAQFGVVMAMKKGAGGLLIISTIFLIYWYLLRWPIRKIIIKKSFDKSPLANHNFKITIKEDGLYFDNNKISWDEILKIVSVENGFLLYLNSDYLYFPYSAFKNIEEKNRFKEEAKKRVNVV